MTNNEKYLLGVYMLPKKVRVKAEKMQYFPGIWTKCPLGGGVFTHFSENVGRKKQKYPSKWLISPQNGEIPGMRFQNS